jgi:hypothetical protein
MLPLRRCYPPLSVPPSIKHCIPSNSTSPYSFYFHRQFFGQRSSRLPKCIPGFQLYIKSMKPCLAAFWLRSKLFDIRALRQRALWSPPRRNLFYDSYKRTMAFLASDHRLAWILVKPRVAFPLFLRFAVGIVQPVSCIYIFQHPLELLVCQSFDQRSGLAAICHLLLLSRLEVHAGLQAAFGLASSRVPKQPDENGAPSAY